MLTSRLGEGVAMLVAPFLVLGTMAIATVAPAVAQLDQAKSTELKIAQEGATAQKTIDKLDNERDALLADYRVTLEQLGNLIEYNEQLRNLIKSQEVEMVSLKEQIERITGIERDIVPLMNNMLGALDQFVQLDVPFLINERTERVEKLKALMGDANATNAEKYRRILEAYQIENDYGRTIESYTGKLGTGEEAKTVTYLKIGRVSFVYQSVDGSEAFVWDQDQKTWVELAGSYDTPVTIAIRMAKEQIPPDLIYVPVKAAVTSN